MEGLSSEGSETEAETQSAPNPQTLSIEQYGDHLVPVKIDGVVENMRLRDAVRGVAHQRAATKAMQELDTAKTDMGKYQRFFDELQKDPERIIRSLQDRFGVTTTNPEVSDVETEQPQQNEEVAALTAQINELKGMLENQQQQHAHDTEVQRINRQLDELEAKYGDGFNRQEVLAHAVQREINDVDVAFRSWHFEQQQAQPAAAPEPNAAAHAAILDSIAPGSPVATPAPPAPEHVPAAKPIDAVRRAFEQLPENSALRQVQF